MSLIRMYNVVKEFRRTMRQTGRFGAIRTLLTRQTEVTRSLDGVSFVVEQGELLGYVGPNGAGKSTTVKILSGILAPTSGEVQVAGLVPWKSRERNALNIGVVFGQRSQLWWDLPLIESLKLIAKIYRVPPAQYRTNLERFVLLLDMDGFIHTPVRQLSLGQRMRGDLAAAMLYEPSIIYLDEPTIGLDVLAKERILGFVEQINREQKTTVVLTTHDLRDVERLCQRILLIDRGRLLYDGLVEGLKARYAPHRVLVVQLESSPKGAIDGASISVPGAESLRQEGSKVWLTYDPTKVPVATLIADVTARYRVTDLSLKEPELDAIVRQIYETRVVAQ